MYWFYSPRSWMRPCRTVSTRLGSRLPPSWTSLLLIPTQGVSLGLAGSLSTGTPNRLCAVQGGRKTPLKCIAALHHACDCLGSVRETCVGICVLLCMCLYVSWCWFFWPKISVLEGRSTPERELNASVLQIAISYSNQSHVLYTSLKNVQKSNSPGYIQN